MITQRSPPILLDEANLAKILIGKKLLSRATFVRGDVRFVLADRRNRNIKITIEGAGGLFTKQAKSREALITLANETAALTFLHGEQDDVTRHLPRKLSFDPRLSLLVTELIPSGQSLHDAMMQLKTIHLDHAEMAGIILAGVHQRPIPRRSRFTTAPAHALSLNRPHYTMLNKLSPANAHLLEAIQSDAGLSASMDDLRRNWRPTAFIHGDAKLDNMVIYQDGLMLVDWELAAIGDPRWDVGTVFSSLLSNWIASMPMAHGMTHEIASDGAKISTQSLQAASRRFWLSYAATCGLGASCCFREEAIAYCGGRLVQTAYEYMQHAPRLTANAIYMLQMAANLLKDPRRAAEFLLGQP